MVAERYGDVGVSLDGHVATVEIQRPPHNYFDHILIADIASAFEALDEVADCRAIVLAAQGKSFCAGANFTARPPGGSDGPAVQTNPLYTAAVRLFRTKKPVVAAIQGAAIGGGLGVALVSDFRVASPEARFAANFVKISFHPGFGLTHTLPRLIGAQRASLLFLTGRRIDGATAHDWGMVDVLTSAENLRADAHALAAEIAENGPLAIVSTRATIRAGLADAVMAATEREQKEQAWLMDTADHAEGVRAVAERRPGRFVGR
ncbi:enoyl-CoA hydratase/isomerase family protein [Zavarzinia sp. CC-PAN008]|uniref:enoyl-CoA hydratase/isomerase family protein n=1 Tax=Zavarzinia sp. CC-PAN008 TaxID=3243332 RepID=UPI003F74A8BF